MIGTGHLWELVVVLVLALIVFGPKRLPELGSGLGKGIRAFQQATHEDEVGSPQEALPARPAAPPYSTIDDEMATRVASAPTAGETVPQP